MPSDRRLGGGTLERLDDAVDMISRGLVLAHDLADTVYEDRSVPEEIKVALLRYLEGVDQYEPSFQLLSEGLLQFLGKGPRPSEETRRMAYQDRDRRFG